jgi:hypothetical protein
MKKNYLYIFLIFLICQFNLGCRKDKIVYLYERKKLDTPIEFIVFNKSSKQIDTFHCIIVVSGDCYRGGPGGINIEIYKGKFEIGKKYNFKLLLTSTIVNKDGKYNGGCPENPINFIAFSTDSTIKNQGIPGIPHPSWYYNQINPNAYRANVNVTEIIKAGTHNYFVAEFKD